MAQYGPVWPTMVKYDQVWLCKAEYDRVWPNMAEYRDVWASMEIWPVNDITCAYSYIYAYISLVHECYVNFVRECLAIRICHTA
jgi:hypothetical protein